MSTPNPKAKPPHVFLTRSCVPGLLRRALAHAKDELRRCESGPRHAHALASLTALEDIVAAAANKEEGGGGDHDGDDGDDDDDDHYDNSDDDDDGDGDGDGDGDVASEKGAAEGKEVPSGLAARRPLGLEPLFNLTQPSLARFLRKNRMPARVELSGVRGKVVFPVFRVVLTRRLEGTVHKPVRWVNFSPRGHAWVRAAGKAAHNGVGMRTLSTNWKDWWSWKPGAYSPEGVPEGWSWVREQGSYIVIDPGIRLPLACHNGLALPAGLWYQHRSAAFDYRRKPEAVQKAERGMGGIGKSQRAWGLITFSKYLSAFYKALPTLRAYYGSPAALRSDARKGDKLRSVLDQLLLEVAPDPQVRRVACVQQDGALSRPAVPPRACSCPCLRAHACPPLPPSPPPAPSFPLQSVIVVGKNFRGQRARKGSQSSPVLQVGGPCPATAGGVRVVPLVHAQVWGWAQAEPLVAVG